MKNVSRIFWIIVICLIIKPDVIISSDNLINVNSGNNLIVTAEGVAYQWFYNGQKLTGVKGRGTIALNNGIYSVEITKGSGEKVVGQVLVEVNSGKIIKIYLIGDSTMATYDSLKYPVTGWGQVFQQMMCADSVRKIKYVMDADSVIIYNHARGGRSTRVFYEEGSWTNVYNAVQPGDYVFIQFGHNDGAINYPDRYVDTAGFKMYLRLYVNQTREKRGIPVLLTPVNRNYPWSGNTLTNIHGNYPLAMKQVAEELHVPLIDVTQRSLDFFSYIGKDYVTDHYFMNLPAGVYENYPDGSSDNTHFQPEGARAVAHLVYEGLKDLRDISVSVFPDSSGYIKGAKWYETKYNSEIEISAFPYRGYKFSEWKGDWSGSVNPLLVTLDSSVTIVADYSATTKPQYCIETSTEGGGNVSILPIGGLYEEDETISSHAFPDTYQKFYAWTGNYRNKVNPLYFNITGDTKLKAIFIEDNATIFQAEDASVSENSIDSANQYFTGDAYAIAGNRQDDSIVWYVWPSIAAQYGLFFRYCNENDTDNFADVYVNGLAVQNNLKLMKSTDASTWNTNTKIYASLKEGKNEIKIVMKESGVPVWIDFLKITGKDFLDPSLGIKKKLDEGFFLTVTPNPVRDKIRITVYTDKSFPVKASLFDYQGRQISNREGLADENGLFLYEWDTENMLAGIYIVNIQINRKTLVHKIFIQ